MSIAVNAIPSLVAAQGVARDLAFQPGSVIAARVVDVSANNQARISIAGQAIDVQTQVPLQAGQTLQLAVSQTANGIRLAVLPQQAAAAAVLSSDLSATLLTTLAAGKAQLTSSEAVAVSQAALGAVTKQASLSTLFANLGAATSLQNLPPKLQQAVAQVLAQRPPLDTELTGGEIKTAFQKSGLFLEASLAQGRGAAGTVPDMKAALIVLRQALTTALGTEAGSKTTAATANPQTAPASQPQVQTPAAPATTTAALTQAAATLVPAMLPKSTAQDDAVQSGASLAPEQAADADIQPLQAAATAPRAAASGGPQRQPDGKLADIVAQLVADDGASAELPVSAKPPAGSAANLPAPVPPPLRGALPSAQPVAHPMLAPDAPPGDAIHHLLNDTEAAIARQTLHQVASLPDRSDAVTASRADSNAPRWSFEIPFAVPQGTAVAQFEITRDGAQGTEADAASQVWRARFSLAIEPAGPIHALVSLNGDKTSVRMWAERPATARQLAAESAALGQALMRANLKPGDIVVREGAPVPPAPPAAGQFLNLAL